MSIRAHAVALNKQWPLAETGDEENISTVPAAYLTLGVEGESLPSCVFLDGELIPLALNEKRTVGFLTFDAFRSVGFHRLEVDESNFLFATEDGKLRLEGVRKMLDHLEADGLTWGSQLFFADGTTLRHPKIDYAWLKAAVPEIIRCAESVSERPFPRTVTVQQVRMPGLGKLFLAETLNLVRRDAKSLLEPSASGPISVAGVRYSPRLVVAGRARLSFDTVGNRRIAWLLRACIELAANLQEHLPRDLRKIARVTKQECEQTLSLLPFAQLISLIGHLPQNPAPEELADARYAETYRFYEQLQTDLGWEPGLRVAPRFAHVRFADEIYQVFVAITLAQALGAPQVETCLESGLDRPVFSSDLYDIYYDTIPPEPFFVNWRTKSSRRADMRPDLTIIDKNAKRGLFLDAKYSVAGVRPKPSAIADVQVYMQSFGVRTIGVCFPGEKLEVSEVSADGNRILEIPISPVEGLHNFLAGSVARLIEAALMPLGS